MTFLVSTMNISVILDKFFNFIFKHLYGYSIYYVSRIYNFKQHYTSSFGVGSSAAPLYGIDRNDIY